MSNGAAAEAQRLAAALYFFWYTRGWFVTGLRWLRATLAAEAPVEPLVKLRTEVALAQLAFIAGDYLASFAAIESAAVGGPAARGRRGAGSLPGDRWLCLVAPGSGAFGSAFGGRGPGGRRPWW